MSALGQKQTSAHVRGRSALPPKADILGGLEITGWHSNLRQSSVVSRQCKPSKEFICELRKRVVARAHDHEAITTAGQADQHVATGAAVWKSKGLAAAPLDFANDIVAADATINCAAEVNWLGHDQNILITQPAR